MSKTRIFITGTSSDLMQRFICGLNQEETEIVGLTRTERPAQQNTRWVVGDVNDPSTFKEELEVADIVLHAAAITHSFESEPYFRTNHLATKQMVEIVGNNAKTRFVFVSSRVAGMNSGAYGKSKFLAEKEVKQGIKDWLIIRPSEIFGGTKGEAIENTINQAIEKRFMICPVGMTSLMYPVHIDEVVKQMLASIIYYPVSRAIITINGDKGFSYRDVIRTASVICAKPTAIIPIPKWTMKILELVLRGFKFQISIVPDQIPRLYAQKEHVQSKSHGVSLETYIANRFSDKSHHEV